MSGSHRGNIGMNVMGQVSRREFLGGGVALSLAGRHASDGMLEPAPHKSVIFLMMVGGPSQLETWDPKPDAPSDIRGPFGSIATAIPGIRINEFMPRISRKMDRMTLVRSLHHADAPIHETGNQRLQTGKLCRLGQEAPYFGSVIAQRLGTSPVILPSPIGHTGVSLPQGQSAGPLVREYEPILVRADPNASDYNPSRLPLSGAARRAFDLSREPSGIRDAYGRSTFGQSCLVARRRVEAGVRAVTVNMFESVFHQVTWDCHGSSPFSTLDDYKRVLLPTFDAAFATLIDDLERIGRLDSTLVVATGEFGRSPKLNHAGGRDHWPHVWSAALVGGGLAGGRVIGASDRTASEPADRPVTPEELLATVYRSVGVDPTRPIAARDGWMTPLPSDIEPIAEVFV